ncbi:efflux RND transporter periplasmic adaptor subunit [Deinococcus cellulosilyticus]|uniref:ABC transporter permease n=1 Tax=Deinococcus cellulosilyticus (strain DSM 18568 / NBRC 106333 / KACC 11606 / 5516J-15) TaxID=1223518 RepID=A0A511MYQ2_DEIC1|nr:efflux RND transporter periplasmic adaptor subunit [Deinococcus cellulosilyticus]GEM45286.1 ABC transporter permease [Deinococcus cellulosilyticus NBRC 106333 = KACC 11606]
MSKHSEPIIPSPGPGKRTQVKAERPRTQTGMIVGVLLTLGVLGAVPYFWLKPRTGTFVLRSYETATVQQSSFTETASLAGTIASADERTVMAGAEGEIDHLMVEEGDLVQQGQELARLRSRSLEDQLLKAQAALEDAQSALEKEGITHEGEVLEARQALEDQQQALKVATSDLRLNEELYTAGAIPRVDVEKARMAVQEAQRKLLAAQVKLRSTQLAGKTVLESNIRKVQAAQREVTEVKRQQQRLVLKAPISGRITSVEVKTGDTLQPSAAVVKLSSVKNLRITADLDEAQAEQVQEGQQVEITLGEKTYPGQVSKVAQDAQTSEKGTFVPVEIRFQTLPSGVKLGASAALEITTDRHEDVLTLPRAEYLSTGGERLVYVIEGEKAIRKEVQFGAQNSEVIEVVSGLEAGDTIVASSYELFKDRTEIQTPRSGALKLQGERHVTDD